MVTVFDLLEEDYVSFEIAKLLKEKGFDWNCITCYIDDEPDDVKYSFCGKTNSTWESRCCSAPTLQMAMKWFRKVHNICITIYPDKENGYEAVLYNIKDDVEIILQSFGIYGSHILEDSYEEAVEEALKYILENLI